MYNVFQESCLLGVVDLGQYELLEMGWVLTTAINCDVTVTIVCYSWVKFNFNNLWIGSFV